ncbi:hypothetical protein, partial [Qipengyuania flava]|uniref:hypothetical protein n=1 Tax=Qipengyuania flava TaxID=192812 RepID=UPI001CD7E115
MTDHNDDDQHWLETVLAGLEERSEAVKQALMEAVTGREGAGPLLGLEPANTENKRENQETSEGSNREGAPRPLLGT